MKALKKLPVIYRKRSVERKDAKYIERQGGTVAAS
jgi:hypothetical protein